ncbi:hypothetical protein TSUD_265010 [Trifolium subterraneum]|uniref:isochorismate synthase n=1 Tax=Trifolium subterraneum TaxID=3900 RepID=A0A2Z6MDI5_TRISU|nr:hypothetical protein TSUD_265010 [Trifolium subterraneum]
MCKGCYLSMNGCKEGENKRKAAEPVGTIETRTLSPVASTAMAMYSLKMAISEMKEDSPFCTPSGIVRVEVPIEEQVEAIDWLHSQNHLLLPRCYFSATTLFSFGLDVYKEVSSSIVKFPKQAPPTLILSSHNIPSKVDWNLAVNRALQMIERNDSLLSKVVLARSTRVVPTANIDPLTWLACLKVEGGNAYQFFLQPPNAPAFIGNTPEQLFHRKWLHITSEALAGTRARGVSLALDHQIELDLLTSPKDDIEFTIVVCEKVTIDPKKMIRKLPRIQHLFAQLTGRLRSEEDEYEILSSLHPSPAVCGFPTEEAQLLIAETEVFDRGMYAGPVGWFGGGESEFAVGIRSALVEQELGALIYAGTGIVEGSNPYLEWDELELKTSQVRLSVHLSDIPLTTND